MPRMSARSRKSADGQLWSRRAAATVVLAAVVAALALPLSSASAAPYPWTHDLAQTLVSLEKDRAPAPHVADWNADGRADLLVGLRSPEVAGGIAVHLRNTDGSLQQTPSSVFASGNASSVIGPSVYFRPLLADWDGDSRPDLIFGQLYGSRGVVLCPNAGSAESPEFNGADCRQLRTSGGSLVGATTGSTTAYVSPEVVDWDEDGDLDLIVGTGGAATEKGVRLYRNTGSGTAPALAAPQFVVSKAATSGLGFEDFYEPDVVDINDDGKKDLMIGGGRRGSTQEFIVRQCLNSGTDAMPAFTSCSFFFRSGLVNNVIDFHDWDGDGFLDLLRGFYSAFIANPVTYFHGKGPDNDGDGLADSLDNCPADANPAELKLDGENPVQIDTDGDGAGDVCDSDDDADGAADASDNCLWTANGGQGDVDGDGRGDACDPKDDRPGYPGMGSYEWQQANKMQWGRKPVILLRADALSLGFRREIAKAVTNEALDRGLAFSLGIIPWNAARFASDPSADYLREKAADPNLEITQHGTYHHCVLVGGVGEEHDCGMDGAQTYNLMRVGHDSLTAAVDFSQASHRLVGFLPPADAYDDATAEATAAMGYNFLASAYYREFPNLMFTDERGLVHVPWSQTACGNGLASWINCKTTSREAHSGVDCADEDICKPTQDGKSYEPWSDYAQNTIKERCRYDIEQRYDGVCSIIFELTVYDKGAGALDPVAFEGYKRVLSDLEELADETGALFMTLGDYAAAKQIDDNAPPSIDIAAPTSGDYLHHEKLTLDFSVSDDLSGVHSITAEFDGRAVEDGDEIDLLDLSLGDHTLSIRAEDTAGNVSEKQVTFAVIATFASLKATVQRFLAAGEISNHGIATSLTKKVEAAERAQADGRSDDARAVLASLADEVRAQRGKKISESAAAVLIADAQWVSERL